MKIREMLDIRVPKCKICKCALGRKMVMRPNYKGHIYFCTGCGTEYKLISDGQADNELYVEYERRKKEA